MNKYFSQELVDNTGACLSFACAIHCMAMPLLVTILPLVGLSFLVSEPAELAIIGGAVVLALGSIVWGIRHHRSWRAFLVLVVGIAFIATAHISAEGIYEIMLHSTGGILLASAHLINRHLCKICPACELEDASGSH
ncbi:MAG: MerC domain-containing protein [Candidatus Poribacteria bacterium]|nr:MerC domain-containing protein [Candidatus Poribacteria bacterium]